MGQQLRTIQIWDEFGTVDSNCIAEWDKTRQNIKHYVETVSIDRERKYWNELRKRLGDTQ